MTPQCIEAGRATRFVKGDPRITKGKQRLYNPGRNDRTCPKITVEQYEKLLRAQNGVCAGCLRPPKKNRLNLDHDHKTRRVRGLLCFRCNYGLGWFQEDADRLSRLAEYLKCL